MVPRRTRAQVWADVYRGLFGADDESDGDREADDGTEE